MLSVAEALDKVLATAGRLPPCRVPLADALGRALAEDVASDVDSPPHDKAMVDGYAVVAADLAAGSAELSILEEITAGAVPTKAVSAGCCSRIMTGAPIPTGADAVVMVERTELLADNAHVRISDRVEPRQNIMPRGRSIRIGEMVLRAGHMIRPAETGLLAEVGRLDVTVYPAVRVAILATGNELVDASQKPAIGQIRNSNGPLLAAAVKRAGAIPVELGIARDEPNELREKIGQGLSTDVLVLSGGVSAGVLDLVPAVLREHGVVEVFHKVSLKPGKPLWFGVNRPISGKSPRSQVPGPSAIMASPNMGLGTWDLGICLVFGLPGNPVSSLVGFELFVRPAIAKLGGLDWDVGLRQLPARLASVFDHRGERPTYFPSIVRRERDVLLVEPVAWRGSADLRGVSAANALSIFPAGDRIWQPGEQVEVLLL